MKYCSKCKKDGFYIHECGNKFQIYKYKSINISNDINCLNNFTKTKYLLFCAYCDMIYKSDLIILSIGNNDFINEDINTISKELSALLSLIRRINNKLIIYISPYNINKTTLLKEVCKKYNIVYLDSKSFNYNDKLISKYIINYISNKNG